ncbi:MAG: hypothetical protein ACP5R5_03145 [Armatimonadota bacterium]
MPFMNLGMLFKWLLAVYRGLIPGRYSRIVCAMAVAFAFAMVIILVGLLTGSTRKIDANSLLSPWDRSHAPPPFISPSAVRIVSAEPRHAGPDRVGRKRPGSMRVAAGAADRAYRWDSPAELSR